MSRYAARGRREADHSWLFTAKGLLRIIGVLGICGALVFWWGVQSAMTANWLVAGGLTLLLSLASPGLTAFIIPWSPAGMLLAKVNAQTWGGAAAAMAAMYLLYYAYTILFSWWAAQPVVAETGLIAQQVIICLILFVIIPALVWTPVTNEELIETVKQAHLVRRYELQTKADIAILRNTLMRAQQQALIGLANLTVQERAELAGVMRGLVTGIDNTLRQIGQDVQEVSNAALPFGSLEDNEDIRGYLDYISAQLTDSTIGRVRGRAAGPEPVAERLARAGEGEGA